MKIINTHISVYKQIRYFPEVMKTGFDYINGKNTAYMSILFDEHIISENYDITTKCIIIK